MNHETPEDEQREYIKKARTQLELLEKRERDTVKIPAYERGA